MTNSSGWHILTMVELTQKTIQLALMSHSLKEAFPGIELGSVDGFQGREKEVSRKRGFNIESVTNDHIGRHREFSPK